MRMEKKGMRMEGAEGENLRKARGPEVSGGQAGSASRQREARAGLGALGTHTTESARQLVTSRGSRQQLAAPTGPLRKGETPVKVGKPRKCPLLPTPTLSTAPRLQSVLRCPQPPLGATLSALRSSSSPQGLPCPS